jgi:hypothetical protein
LQLDEQIEKGLVDGLRARYAKQPQVAAALEREPHAEKHGIEFDSCLFERLWWRDTRGEIVFFAGLQRDDFDFGIERRAERRQNGQPAEPCRERHRRRTQ